TRTRHLRNAFPRSVPDAKTSDAPNILLVQGQRPIRREESESRRQEKGTPNEPVIRDLTTDRYVQVARRHNSFSFSVNFYKASMFTQINQSPQRMQCLRLNASHTFHDH